MQSIAPDKVFIEVVGPGVNIGGEKRAVGWQGYVTREQARALVQAELVKPASPKTKAAPAPTAPAAPAETVEANTPVVDTATEPDVVPSKAAEKAAEKDTAPTKRVPRNGRK